MFDIGFWELVTIGVVALLVLGPERLPAVARTAGLWFGKARRFLSSVKADIDREIKAEELKQIMAEQAKSSGLYDIVEETQAALDDATRKENAADTSLKQEHLPSDSPKSEGDVQDESHHEPKQ